MKYVTRNGKRVKLVLRKKNSGASPIRLQTTPAERISTAGRGFRLSFGCLPSQRKLTAPQLKILNKETAKVKRRMLKQARSLFDKHPALTQLSSAKSDVYAAFHAGTLPFPEPGVRLFMLNDKDIDYENMQTEEIEAHFGAQINEFTRNVRNKLDAYDAAVARLQQAWPDVLRVAREALEDLFSESDYPTADQLPVKLYHEFVPYNITLPKEYGYVDRLERERVIKAFEKQFEEAVQLQEVFVTKMFSDAVDQLIDSVSGYHMEKQKRFGNSVVKRVFDAFAEFKEKTLKYGIMEGSKLEKEFNRAIAFMTDGAHDVSTLPEALRKSPEKREELISKMSQVSTALTSLATEQRRRTIRRD